MILALLVATTIVSTEIVDDMPFFPVEVAGRTLWFTIDTGSPYTFIDSAVAADLRLRSADAGVVHGAGAGDVRVESVDSVSFVVAGLTLSGHEVRLTDLSGPRRVFRHAFDGFFGYDLLREFVVTFDPVPSRIILRRPAEFRPPAAAESLPLWLGGKHRRWVFVKGTVKVAGAPAAEQDFLLDSGSSDAVDTPLIKRSTGPLQKIETGNGLGEPIEGVLGRVQWLRLGKQELRDLPSNCCSGAAGADRLIGQGVLSKFVTTFDYSRMRLFLEPLRPK